MDMPLVTDRRRAKQGRARPFLQKTPRALGAPLRAAKRLHAPLIAGVLGLAGLNLFFATRSAEGGFFRAALYASAAAMPLACLALAGVSSFTLRRLYADAQTDPLTGLLNRRGGFFGMRTLLGLCKRHGRPAAIMMFDIDRFKLYNDALGHAAGDEALCRIAQTLDGVFARASDLVFRYGGEEFLAVCSVSDAAAARMLAERARLAVQELGIQTVFGDAKSTLTVSVGVVIYQPGADAGAVDEDQLLKMADLALYAAKSGGRNRVEQYII